MQRGNERLFKVCLYGSVVVGVIGWSQLKGVNPDKEKVITGYSIISIDGCIKEYRKYLSQEVRNVLSHFASLYFAALRFCSQLMVSFLFLGSIRYF